MTDDILLSAHQTWDAQSGDIVISGDINGNNKKLTISGANDTTLSGVLSGLAYNKGLVKSDSGTLFLEGNNTFTGPIKVKSGTVQLAHDNALGGTAWSNNVESGGALSLTGGIIVNQGSFDIGGSGTGGRQSGQCAGQ
ncbi:MAG: autotransporter-associated beta strand repeat-containing protein [Candidatus Synoicihabitans palmerolidicus]|nr:autotransporter-associated beta strand repeat-containing protein [Candidatus Synoicihabitans palmerolidicus]